MKNNPFIRFFEYPNMDGTVLHEDNTMGIVTAKILTDFAPALAKDADTLAAILNASKINTKLRLAHFLAQAAHESGKFTVTRENLNYSAASLGAVFKKYFPTSELQQQYARKPEAIANKVYADRMGNGNEKSGDGWLYRGRGFFQLTGKNNYYNYSKAAYGDDRLVKNPDAVAELVDAMKSAIWYWETNNLSKWADQDDALAVSRAVNLGNANSTATPNGWDDRKKNLAQIKKILGI